MSDSELITALDTTGTDSQDNSQSDEASENELLDKSLSLWKGWDAMDRREAFTPVPLDLHTACSLGLLETVKELAKWANLDKKNKGGWTPLMYACYIGHYVVVDHLLSWGVDINAKNHKGQTPLILAATCGNESVGHLLCQHGVELEAQDNKGASALLHATYSGHQNMVLFLLEQGANINQIEPTYGVSPLMQAADEGHEIIVQIFLTHGVDVEAKAYNGDTARSVALLAGHTKIVSLIENHVLATIRSQWSEQRRYSELSSSDEGRHMYRPHPQSRGRRKGPSIHDGPEAFARYLDNARQHSPENPSNETSVPQGYVTFNCNTFDQENTGEIRSRDMTSPINPEDYTFETSDLLENDEGGMAFSKTSAITIKSSSSSSGGLAAALGISRESSQESLEDKTGDKNGENSNNVFKLNSGNSPKRTLTSGKSTPPNVNSGNLPQQNLMSGKSPPQHLIGNGKLPQTVTFRTENHDATKNYDNEYKIDNKILNNMQSMTSNSRTTNDAKIIENTSQQLDYCSRKTLDNVPSFYASTPVTYDPNDPRPKTLATFLIQIGLSRYLTLFEEQDVDFPVFLSLTENHLSEIGVKLFGHRRKLAIAITRWHSQAPAYNSNELEQVYANRLETEMQEMAKLLHQTYGQVEALRGQVLQEEELRAVTESCLMEEKGAWQHVQRVTMDTRQQCDETRSQIANLKILHGEIRKHLERASKYSNLPHPPPHSDINSLTSAIKDSFSLADSTRDVGHVTSETLVANIDTVVSKIQQSVSIVTRNCDMLLCQTNSTKSDFS